MIKKFYERSKKTEKQRGAALVEFAIILPILIALFGAVIDFGEAWFSSTSVQSGVRAASVVGFDAGNDFDHDYRVMKTIMDELDSRGIDEINRIVIYDADAVTDIPSGCYATSETGGVTGICNSYSGAFLDRVISGDALAEFDANSCPGSADRMWCSTTRGGAIGTPFSVGVEVSITDGALIGFMPFFQEYTVVRSAVMQEIVR